MNTIVTGGAGFIGRSVVKRLLELGHDVTVFDDLSNGSESNLAEFRERIRFVRGDIKDYELLSSVFADKFDVCWHLAASINVQDSIDDPETTFYNDVVGTFNVLEMCRKQGAKIVFMSTCMVYDMAEGSGGITEEHPLKPASPYAGSKIAAENMALSYYHAYGLPVVVVRPFNTYGPYQKTGGEGGVVAIFIKNKLNGLGLNIYGSGEQTRDLLYVSDCAEFVIGAGLSDAVNGRIVNAGTGRDISINDLALLIAKEPSKIKHIPHIHPQSEIKKLLCNSKRAKELLGFEPKVSLEEGLALTEKWVVGEMRDER